MFVYMNALLLNPDLCKQMYFNPTWSQQKRNESSQTAAKPRFRDPKLGFVGTLLHCYVEVKTGENKGEKTCLRS